MNDIVERVILVGVDLDNGEDTEGSLTELAELARTAGAVTVGTMIQARNYPNPGTYIGSGKIEELKELIYDTGATGVICDDELTPSQMKNLEGLLDVKVMDRTVLILDIFATRATTREGKIQVELAQLKYSLTRLSGYGTSMSRLGGGIGTRGPGETKLESDRRVVRNRVAKLNQDLKEVVRHREVNRIRREKNRVPVVAIVGYTNAGKSTLLNKLTDAKVLSEDKLFATLDPTTREYRLPSSEKVLLTDTVGFIHKLPHHLVEAFKSTLEEAKYSDIIVHVVDASDEKVDNHMKVVYETLNSLGVSDKPVITLFNKCDRLTEGCMLKDLNSLKSFYISAHTGEGIDEFLNELSVLLRDGKHYFEGIIPFERGSFLQEIRLKGELITEEYTESGVKITAYLPDDLYGRI